MSAQVGTNSSVLMPFSPKFPTAAKSGLNITLVDGCSDKPVKLLSEEHHRSRHKWYISTREDPHRSVGKELHEEPSPMHLIAMNLIHNMYTTNTEHPVSDIRSGMMQTIQQTSTRMEFDRSVPCALEKFVVIGKGMKILPYSSPDFSPVARSTFQRHCLRTHHLCRFPLLYSSPICYSL